MALVVRAILPERNVWIPADFTLAKLPTVLGVLRADERRVCMLVGDAAKEILENTQTTHNQSLDGELFVLFQHDYPDFYSGLTWTLNTEITRRRIRQFFCPVHLQHLDIQQTHHGLPDAASRCVVCGPYPSAHSD